MDHLEVLDMIARGLFGCPESLPRDLPNWPQVRPAMRAAHAELEAARARIAELEAENERLKSKTQLEINLLNSLANWLRTRSKTNWAQGCSAAGLMNEYATELEALTGAAGRSGE